MERNTQTKYDEALSFFNRFGQFTEKCLNVLFNEIKSPTSRVLVAIFLQQVIEKEQAWRRHIEEIKEKEAGRYDGSA